MTLPLFDAHLDLACLAVNGRDMTATDPSVAGGPWQPAGVTLPSLAAGGVRLALGTVFTERGGDGPEGYPEDDLEAAHWRGRAQLEAYLTWRDQGLLAIDLPGVLKPDPQVGAIRGGMGVSETVSPTMAERLSRLPDAPALHMGVLIEGADPVRSPLELAWWAERGVVAIGLAWWKPSRYAGGNGSPDIGLTAAGRDLVQAMDEIGLVHDLSHLSQRATDDLLALTSRPVIASHSNCRALMRTNAERHLSDETIREIARRGGVIGLNLVSAFLSDDAAGPDGGRAAMDDVNRHVEHICELTGSRAHIGLGTDMDGGIPASKLPESVNSPADLTNIVDALGGAGWSEADLDGFRCLNWAHFFEAVNLTPARYAARVES